MTRQLRARGRIDTLDPVNWDHLLNRGRKAWWLALPRWMGGATWRDLCRKSDGTLTNGPTWKPTTRAGGAGCVRSAGGTERVEHAASTGLPTGAAAPWTVAFWHRTTSYVSLSQVFGFGQQLPADGGGAGIGTDRYVLQFNSNYYFWGGSRDWDTGIAWDSDAAWHHAAFTSNGATLAFFRDGASRASAAIPSFLAADTIVTAFGKHSSGASSPSCDLDDATIFDRALSATDVASLYDLSRRGYPGLLNRVGRPRSGAAAGGVTGGPFPFFSRRVLSGGMTYPRGGMC